MTGCGQPPLPPGEGGGEGSPEVGCEPGEWEFKLLCRKDLPFTRADNREGLPREDFAGTSFFLPNSTSRTVDLFGALVGEKKEEETGEGRTLYALILSSCATDRSWL